MSKVERLLALVFAMGDISAFSAKYVLFIPKGVVNMRRKVLALALCVIMAMAFTVNSFAFSTYVSYSNKTISTVGTKVTGSTSLSAATYKAVITSNSNSYNVQSSLISSNGDKQYYAGTAIYGVGNADIAVKSSGSYYLCLNSLGNGSTKVSGYFRSQS